MAYVKNCAMKGCKNKADAQQRFGGYCYWHRNYDRNFILSGGDNAYVKSRIRALAESHGIDGKIRQAYVPATLPPAQVYANLYKSGYGMSSDMSKRIGWACHKMEHDNDTNPQWVRENSEERFNQMGSLLLKTKIDKESFGIMHVEGLTLKPFSTSISTVGRESHHPHVSHDVILISDYDEKRMSEPKVYAIDPNIAMFAPTENPGDLSTDEFPSGRTPFTEGVWVVPMEKYVKSPLMKWDRFGDQWMT